MYFTYEAALPLTLDVLVLVTFALSPIIYHSGGVNSKMRRFLRKWRVKQSNPWVVKKVKDDGMWR